MISFTAYGVPAPKGSMKAFMPKGARFPIVTHDNAKTKPWAETVKWAAINATKSKNIFFESGAVCIHVAFFMKKPQSAPKKVIPMLKKPDIDKLLRSVLDALKGIIWTDDSQVTEISATKDYAESGMMPRAEIRVDQLQIKVPSMERVEAQLGLRSLGMGA